MKRLVCTILLAIISILVFGQKNNGTLKFLGIPVDGSETQFAARLKAKGFSYNNYLNGYKGQFNGKNVEVYIHTNHNLVDRVYVSFPATSSERKIKNEYNILLSQFKNTGKYSDIGSNTEIPEEEDISYEMTVNNKEYQAVFSYFDPDVNPLTRIDALLDKFQGLLPDEEISLMKEYTKKAINLPEEEQQALAEKMINEMSTMGLRQEANSESGMEKSLLLMATFIDGVRSMADGDVWFTIHENLGEYNIGLYYDNRHNKAHGEDL